MGADIIETLISALGLDSALTVRKEHQYLITIIWIGLSHRGKMRGQKR